MAHRIALVAALAVAAAAPLGCWDMSKSSFAEPDGGDTDTDAGCGELQWVAGAGDDGEEISNGVCSLGGGTTLVVAGTFTGTAVFDEAGPSPVTMTAAGCHDGFLASYGPGGAFQWARRVTGAGHDEILGIAPLASGSFAATGSFEDDALFGEGGMSTTTLDSQGGGDVFVARYDATGSLEWTKRAGGDGDDGGLAVTGVGSSAVALAVTGSFEDDAVFGEGDDQLTLVMGNASASMFVAAYDNDGNLAWAEQAAGETSGLGVGAIPSGDVWVAGTLSGTAVFGPGGEETELESLGGTDMFLARYSPGGTLAWAVAAGGAEDVSPASLVVLPDGSAVVVGTFWGTAFGLQGIDETSLASAGDIDVFIAFFAANGELAWTRRAGGAKDDRPRGVTALEGGGFVVVGGFQETALFGPGEANETSLTVSGEGSDAFVSVHDSEGNLVCARREGGSGTDDGATAAVAPTDLSLVVTGEFSEDAVFGLGEERETTFDLPTDSGKDVFLWRYSFD